MIVSIVIRLIRTADVSRRLFLVFREFSLERGRSFIRPVFGHRRNWHFDRAWFRDWERTRTSLNLPSSIESRLVKNENCIYDSLNVINNLIF